METVNDLIKRLKTSRMTIYKRLHELYIKNSKLKNHTFIKKGKRYFDDTLVNMLEKSIKNYKYRNPYNSLNYTKFTSLQAKNRILSVKNADLRDQLLRQEKLLKSLNNSNNNLEKLLNQQQQLELSDKRENKRLRNHLKIKGNINHQKPGRSSKKHFWGRFFNF